MFDAKKLLDAIVAGSSKSTEETRQSGGIGELFSQLQEKAGEGGLGDILSQVTGSETSEDAGQGGGIGSMIGNVLKQATGGVQDAASDVNDATGAGNAINDLIGQLTGGQDMGGLIDKAKELAGNNKMATGAVIGGLGSLLLGTKSGRSIATGAAKLGGLALIGGLAYSAYNNYKAGRGFLEGEDLASVAPEGSGFEPTAQSDDQAKLYLRTMIAAAASDGEIDDSERQTILGGLKNAGLDESALDFIASEFSNPASIQELVDEVADEETATQVYTAARVAIEPETQEEQSFLSQLAASLGIDGTLKDQVDQSAASIKV